MDMNSDMIKIMNGPFFNPDKLTTLTTAVDDTFDQMKKVGPSLEGAEIVRSTTHALLETLTNRDDGKVLTTGQIAQIVPTLVAAVGDSAGGPQELYALYHMMATVLKVMKENITKGLTNALIEEYFKAVWKD